MLDTESTQTAERLAINIPEKAPSPLGCYSHAVRAGRLLFISGQGARNPKTGKEAGVTLDDAGHVVSYDIEAQTHAVIQNLQSVLQAAGCTLHDLVEVQVFLANMADFERYNRVYAQYFSFGNPPARTTIEARPPGHNFIEMRATALCPASPSKS